MICFQCFKKLSNWLSSCFIGISYHDV